MNDRKYRIIADLVTGMAERAEDIRAERRADFLLDLLGAAFDAGEANRVDEQRRHAHRVGELTHILQMLVDDLRHRQLPTFASDRPMFDFVASDIRDRIARTMARDWRNE